MTRGRPRNADRVLRAVERWGERTDEPRGYANIPDGPIPGIVNAETGEPIHGRQLLYRSLIDQYGERALAAAVMELVSENRALTIKRGECSSTYIAVPDEKCCYLKDDGGWVAVDGYRP